MRVIHTFAVWHCKICTLWFVTPHLTNAGLKVDYKLKNNIGNKINQKNTKNKQTVVNLTTAFLFQMANS